MTGRRRILIFISILGLIIMSATEQSIAQNKGHYATVNGLKMYYEMHGSGSALVLIHGGGSTLYTTFGKVLPMLAKTHKIIGVELQAHGHTPDRSSPSSFEQDADDVAELLKQLNISGADIFGFSNGGNTAMQVAIRHPDRVRKLIVASSFYKRSGMIDGFWDFMKNGTFEDMPQVYKDEYLRINPSQTGLMAMYTRDAIRMQTFQDWKDADLKSITAPSLIVIGDQDVMKPEHAIEMSRLIPHARLATIPGGHGSYIGEIMWAGSASKVPELFVAILEEFLDEPMPR